MLTLIYLQNNLQTVLDRISNNLTRPCIYCHHIYKCNKTKTTKNHTKALLKRQIFNPFISFLHKSCVNPGNMFPKGQPTYQEAVTGME